MVGNFRVRTFTHPDEMISHLHDKPFALVLDHYFGNEDAKTGLDYLKFIKKKNASLPIIYYTASDDSTLPDKVLKMGAFEFIFKDLSSFVRLRTALDKLEVERIKKEKGGFLKRIFR